MRRYLIPTFLLLAAVVLAPLSSLGLANGLPAGHQAPSLDAAPQALDKHSYLPLIQRPFGQLAQLPGGTCTELLANNSFEANANWVFPVTPVQGGYTGVDKHTGARSARLGLMPGAAFDAVSPVGPRQRSLTGAEAPDATGAYSSVYQDVSVPATGDQLVLSFWYKWTSQDPTQQDLAQALILANDQGQHQFWAELTRIYATDGQWRQLIFDITQLRGHKISVAFETYNHSTVPPSYAWMFVDDVSLEICNLPTPTPTLTPTPTNTPVPAATATPLPALTPIPAMCTNLVQNPSFEANAAWEFPVTASTGHYSSQRAYTGVRSGVIGLEPGTVAAQRAIDAPREVSLTGKEAPDVLGTYSSVYQPITIPASSYPVTMTVQYWLNTTDTTGSDLAQFLILADNKQFTAEMLRIQPAVNTGGWQQQVFDLSVFRGRTIYVAFEVYNHDPYGNTRTWMYVDDVAVASCPIAAPAH